MNALFVSNQCPCDAHDDDLVPAFIQGNFFCESGLHSPWRYQYILYPDDVLWDGQNYNYVQQHMLYITTGKQLRCYSLQNEKRACIYNYRHQVANSLFSIERII